MLTACLIVKPTPEEAKLLDRCLCYLKGNVDEICITQAGEKPIKEVSDVIKKYKGKESFYKWTNNFADARNFNFSQATGDYIFWCDSDDIVKGAEGLRGLIEEIKDKNIDAVAMNYLYDFNESKECTVKHIKTRIIKKGSAKWVGSVHEDFESTRDITTYLCKDISILHLTNEKRSKNSVERNLGIALSEMERNPKDPRSTWLVANAYWGANNNKEAVKNFELFIKQSGSEEEKYVANMVLASLADKEEYALKALSIRPTYPNAYHKIAEFKFNEGKYQIAIDFIEIGLQLPIPELKIIVFNPRDYDYNPLMLMIKCYWKLGKTKKAVQIVDNLAEMFPNDKLIMEKKVLLDEELGEINNIEKYLKEAESIKNKVKLKEYLDNLPEKVRNHPSICSFKNQRFIKTESNGKDLVFYCSYTMKAWNPDIAEKDGVGGSEEAVINLSRELVKLGWNISVYNNCGKGGEWDGVKYRPFWEYNVRDKQDWTILWRHPKPVDYNPNSKIAIDMHDVLRSGEFTEERLQKIDKVFVKSNAHKILFPNIPEEKFAVIANGIDPELFEEKIEKNPYLILNTSSADRHLDATLDVFEELVRRQPDKPWKLAWYYGWGLYDAVHKNNPEMLEWKRVQMERFEKLKKEGRAEGGTMIGHKDIAKKYLEAGIFLYPSEFYEIDCISARKAQLAGCKLITSDFAALNETVLTKKIHTKGEKWEKENTFGDTENRDKYVEAIIKWENKSDPEFIAKEFNWGNIAKKWDYELR